MKHLFVVGILLISCGFISAIEWPKIDIGQILNPSILGKESIRAPAVPGKIQIQTITYNSPVPIDHINNINNAGHDVKTQIVYSDASRKSATITVEAPKGQNIDSNFIVFKKKA